MANGLRFILVAAVLGTTLASAGCAPPCDRYCNSTAAYIERCIAESTQSDWLDAQEAGFAYWGYSDADEFTAGCKEDMNSQLSSAADSSVLAQACEDEANDWDLLEGRGQCAELP
jgi:hypothetical protein